MKSGSPRPDKQPNTESNRKQQRTGDVDDRLDELARNVVVDHVGQTGDHVNTRVEVVHHVSANDVQQTHQSLGHDDGLAQK